MGKTYKDKRKFLKKEKSFQTQFDDDNDGYNELLISNVKKNGKNKNWKVANFHDCPNCYGRNIICGYCGSRNNDDETLEDFDE